MKLDFHKIEQESDFLYDVKYNLLPRGLANKIEFGSNRETYNYKKFLNDVKELTKKDIPLIISINQEVIQEIEIIDDIKSLVESDNYLITCATSSIIDKFTHPLSCLSWHWLDAKMRYTVDWNSKYSVPVFDELHFKKEDSINKTIKGILSIRKNTDTRTELFNKIDKDNFDGILRYINYTQFNQDETTEHLKLNPPTKFPTYFELLEEYKKSYVAFIVETESGELMNPLSEKTLISFLTLNIPIIFNNSNSLKELKEIGFYTFNDEFGNDDVDSYPFHSRYKIKKYTEIIDTYNSMTLDDIKLFYEKNFDKILKNYKLAHDFIFYKPKYNRQTLI